MTAPAKTYREEESGPIRNDRSLSESATARPAKTPPFSEDAEVSLLSAILIEAETLDRVRAIVREEDFYYARHRLLFTVCASLHDRGVIPDPITVSNLLLAEGTLSKAGGREYLGYLMDAVPTTANAPYHASIIREKAERRRLIEKLNLAMNELWSGPSSVHDVAVALSDVLTPAAVSADRVGFVHVSEDLVPTIEDVENKKTGVGSEFTIATGYPEIDEAIDGGMERGDLMVIAGVPGGCKTAAAMNIALNVVRDHEDDPRGAAIVSAEMNRRKLMRRNLATVGRIDFTALKTGALNPQEWHRLTKAAMDLKGRHLWTDQTPSPAIEDIIAKVRALKKDHPTIALVIVDFIQLVQRALAKKNMRDENRSLELTAISYTLKEMAKNLDVAVIATCQVDAAGIDKRSDKRPHLADARWSQGMREAADLFALVYRDKQYNPDPMAADILELNFEKARDSKPFKANLVWQGNHMRVTSASRESRLMTQQARLYG
jgi:replicative DNA helicase